MKGAAAMSPFFPPCRSEKHGYLEYGVMEGLAEQGGVTFTDSDMLKTTRSVFFSERRNFRSVIVPNFGYIRCV